MSDNGESSGDEYKDVKSDTYQLGKGSELGKIGETVMLFEQTLQPAGSSRTSIPKATNKRGGRGTKISVLNRVSKPTPSKPLNTNDLLIHLVNKLDKKVDEIKIQNTTEIDKMMEAAKTALTLSLKNNEEITTLKENDARQDEEIVDIRKEIENVNRRNLDLEKVVNNLKKRTNEIEKGEKRKVEVINQVPEAAASDASSKVDQEKGKEKKSYAQILQEERLKNNTRAENPRRYEPPVFLVSDKKPEELFNEAKERVGIENCNAKEVRRYLWRGTNPDGESTDPDLVSDDELMYSEKYRNERMEAATGILIDRFGFYMSEIYIDEAWFCNLRGRNTMYIQSSNKFFIRSTYWKAASSRDQVFRMAPWIPIAANERKRVLERRLAQIRKTQDNLRTQVRMGIDDFEVYGKYLHTGRQEKFELLPSSVYDPNNDLPGINCRDAKKEEANTTIIEREYEKMNARDKTDKDGFSPAKGKRKIRSPLSGEKGKRTRVFSPSKAGKSIYNMIRNRGLVDTVNLDTSGSESDETDDDEETNVVGASILNETKNKPQSITDVNAKPADDSKADESTKLDADPKIDASASVEVVGMNVQDHSRS